MTLCSADWTIAEIQALLELPLMELLGRRSHCAANPVTGCNWPR